MTSTWKKVTETRSAASRKGMSDNDLCNPKKWVNIMGILSWVGPTKGPYHPATRWGGSMRDFKGYQITEKRQEDEGNGGLGARGGVMCMRPSRHVAPKPPHAARRAPAVFFLLVTAS